MSLYKRKESPYWWIAFTIHGQRIQESTGTTDRAEAEEYHDTRKAQAWRQLRLGEKPSRSWEEAVLRYVQETSHKRSHKNDLQRLRWLDQHLSGAPLTVIDRDFMDRVMSAKRAASPATQNRYLGVVRAVLNKAYRDWGWVDAPPNLRMRKEPRGRLRWLTVEEIARLLAALPEHLRPPVKFALATGLRQSNVFHLGWGEVDLDRRVAWVYGDAVKTGQDLRVPLNSAAVDVLRNLEGVHPERVFTYKGRPMTRFCSNTWAAAIKAARLPGVRFHDLRHTWASWHVMNGTSPRELMELGGWSEYRTVLRYTHLASWHLTDAAERVSSTIPLQGGL